MLAAACAALAVLAAGCAGTTAHTASGATRRVVTPAAAAARTRTATTTTTSDPRTAGPASGGTAATRGVPRAVSKPVPPAQLPWKSTLPLHATVSPACVRPGGIVTLTVIAHPGAGIGYEAVYSDTKGGAEPPFGGGYGGNDKGFSDSSGTFVSRWVVSTNAPAGTGRIDVIAGLHRHWGYAGPAFAVAGPNGTCS